MDEVVVQFQSMGKLLSSQFSFLTCNWFQRENIHINTYYLVCSTDVWWRSHTLYETPIEARVMPTSGQQVRSRFTFTNFYALTECVYFLIHYKEWWVNQKVSQHLEKHQKLWMLFWTVFQLSKATWFSTAGLEDLQD